MTGVSARAHRRKTQRQKDPRKRSLSDSGGSASASIVGSAPVDLVNMEEVACNKGNVSYILIDHLLVLVLSHLSARNLCICKCVCRSWNLLITQPEFRKELPQIVTGFFLFNMADNHFASIFSECPSFSFLPWPMDKLLFSDCRNDLILIFRATKSGGHYVVCNPVTMKYVVTLDIQDCDGSGRFGFNPTVSLHFHVVELHLKSQPYGVHIYSSKTGAWMYKKSEWGENFVLLPSFGSVFVSGFMHMLVFRNHIVAFDMERKTWRKLVMPEGFPLSMNQDNGQFCLCTANDNNSDHSIWILEDYGANKWILKHTVQTLQVFGTPASVALSFVNVRDSLKVIALYPEWNLIFLCTDNNRITLMAYDMSHGKVHALPAAMVKSYESRYFDCLGPHCMPYVPLLMEMESLAEK